jgi:hypothetical protein
VISSGPSTSTSALTETLLYPGQQVGHGAEVTAGAFYWGMDSVGADGRPGVHRPIEEIDLEQFDFEGFEREQARPAVANRRS